MLYNKGQHAEKEPGTVSKGILDLAFSPSQKGTVHNKIWTNCTMAACLYNQMIQHLPRISLSYLNKSNK